jgi:hypothetical protein
MIEITQYQIIAKDNSIDLKYNGHTTDFERRKSQHIRVCNNCNSSQYNFKLYQTIREQNGFDNFEFVILEKHFVDDIIEARIREQYWYDLLQSNLNTHKPYVNTVEYTNQRRQTIEYKEYQKDYQHQYHQTDKHKEYQKEYRQLEKYKKQQQEYNKVVRKIKITCECGSILCKRDIARHQKSKKHLEFVNNK